MKISRLGSPAELVSKLRSVGLKGDPHLNPYASAKIDIQLVQVSRLSPLSKYYLFDKLERQCDLREQLLEISEIDTLNLPGGLHYSDGIDDKILSPPVIEVYHETEGDITGEIWALVDGTHRCSLARKLGIAYVRAVVIHDVPKHFPLIAFPLNWDEIVGIDVIHDHNTKRKYRFPDLDSFPEISSFSSKKPMSAEECKYFFYRNLEFLGSLGPRPRNDAE